MGYDPRFDEMEEELDSWRSWKPKSDTGAPNPLVIRAEEWVDGLKSDYGDFSALHGVDRHGNKWSVAAVGMILGKTLVDGVFEEWDEASSSFKPTGDPLGKVQVGEMVGITYDGEGQGAKFNYSKYKVSRKVQLPEGEKTEPAADGKPDPAKDDLPF